MNLFGLNEQKFVFAMIYLLSASRIPYFLFTFRHKIMNIGALYH